MQSEASEHFDNFRILILNTSLRILTALCFLVIFTAAVFPSSLQTVPLYHWTYDIIDELIIRGCLHDLNMMSRPYNYSTVQDAIDKCDIQDGDSHAESMLNLLREYFEVESDRKLQIGSYIDQDIKAWDDQIKPRTGALLKTGYTISDRLTFYNGMRLDQNLRDDPEYEGKYWRGFSGYTEQAYISAKFGPVGFQFGRDYMQWGPGRKSNLLFSDNSLPFDLAKFTLNAGSFIFTMAAIQLDAVTVADSNLTTGAVESNRKNRFLSAHRIDWKISDKFQAGISESVLYGGTNRSFEWQFLNPVIVYHFEQENRNIEGNTIVGADFIAFPAERWSVHGEVIVDDWQFDRKKVSDLEPPEVGWIIGCRKAAPFGLESAAAGLEYSGITNRTYNTLQPEQKHVHQNKVIGHELGNDFDCWRLDISNWFSDKIRTTVGFSFIRNGEGSVEAPFDTSFYAVEDVSDGYSEPFPTGIVERIYEPEIKIWYRFSGSLFFRFESKYSIIDNYQHEKGKSHEEYMFRAGMNYQFDNFFSI